VGRRVVALVALVALGACRDPTEITVDLRTDIACSASSGTTSMAVGSSFETLPDDPASTVGTCAPDGEIGTLVLVPSGEKNAEVVIEVIAGVRREACSRHGSLADCVLARRSLRFQPHTDLRLPIFLSARCAGVVCGPNETCNAIGACVSAACVDVGCSNLTPAPPPVAVTDASAPPLDGGRAQDGAVTGDGGPAVCPALTQGVDCDLGLCQIGQYCCRNASCIAPTDACNAAIGQQGVSECDETGDCAAGNICCFRSGASPGAVCAPSCAGVAAKRCKQDCECGPDFCLQSPACDVPTCGGRGCGAT
jgi:hypothetical protein